MQKEKKFKKKALSTFLLILLGAVWIGRIATCPLLPSVKCPVVFYASELRSDLKIVAISALKSAKKSIHLQMYALTDPDILQLLKNKEMQGVEVTIFYDPSASPSGFFSKFGFSSFFPVHCSGLMHRKILTIDHVFTLMGTANFTTTSLKMHGNVAIGIWDSALARFFEEGSKNREEFEIQGRKIKGFLLPDFIEKTPLALGQILEEAKKEIHLAMFTLTHPDLVDSLIAAHKKGVEVCVAIDSYTASGASLAAIQNLQNAGIKVLVSQGEQLLHHKWAIIDQKTFILGSANWTSSAFTKNQDSLLVFSHLKPKEERFLKKLWKTVAKGAQSL